MKQKTTNKNLINKEICGEQIVGLSRIFLKYLLTLIPLYLIGGIIGAISSGLQVYNASKLWANTGNKTAYRQMVEHYHKHVIVEGQKSVAKNIVSYSKQASQFFANNSSSGNFLRAGVIKIHGAPGGIFEINGLIRSFWYIK